MRNLAIIYRLILVIVLSFSCSHLKSQIFFKKYVDTEKNCDEFNTQVLTKNDSIFLINFISCDSLPYYTTILQFDLKGNQKKLEVIKDLIPNINSGHLTGNEFFIAGVNNDLPSDTRFVLWDGTVDLDSSSIIAMDLFTSPVKILNPMGSISLNSSKIVYGQYKLNNNSKVFSFLLWLDYQLKRDSLILIDTTYDWSVISDAKIDSKNNLVILFDAAIVIDHLPHFYRIIEKYNSNKEKVFEWISPPFVGEGLGSFTIVDSNSIVLSFVAEENDNIHSLIAIDKNGDLLWEHIFHLDDPKSLYRIKDIITCSDGGILSCGTYINHSQNIPETGYVCKLDRNGNLLWERVFYDQEELELPESGIDKIIHFNSIAESPNHSIIIGGRVIHKVFTTESQNDILFAVLDSSGCIHENCSNFQDITRVDDFKSAKKTWTEGYEWNDATWSFRYKFDTIPIELGENTYNELLRSNSEFSNSWEPTGNLIRCENGRVFQERAGSDQIIYDFTLAVGDTFHLGNENIIQDLVVEKIDTISLLNGDLKRRWYLQPLNPVDPFADNTIVWIEGIGNLKGLFANDLPWSSDAENLAILCVYWIDNRIYDNPDIEGCWIMSTPTKEINKQNVNIFPNPSNDRIYINGLDSKIDKIRVFNNYGMLMYQGISEKVEISGFPAGCYYVHIILSNKQFKILRFVKL